MKNMYDVWVMDLDNMDASREDTAEHYIIAAKTMSAAIAKVEKAYEDPEKGPERHFVIWAETKYNGEELPRDMYEIWEAEHISGEDMAELMETSHWFLFKALKQQQAKKQADMAAGMDMTEQAATDKLAEISRIYDEPFCHNWNMRFVGSKKLSDNPYQE